jgi:chromosome segregation ATPase
VLTDASNEIRPSTEIPEARPKTTSDLEAVKRPAGSFTAKIDELTRKNLALMTELEQWRSTALKAEALNRELGASLDAARLSMNTLQQEKERVKGSYRQNALAVNFFRTRAAEADAVVKELFSAFESIKAKIPAVCPDSEPLQGQKSSERMKFVALFMYRFIHRVALHSMPRRAHVYPAVGVQKSAASLTPF